MTLIAWTRPLAARTALGLLLLCAAVPATAATPTPGPHGATTYTGPHGGTAVVGPNGRHAAQGANGRGGASGTNGAVVNGKHGSGAYDKNTKQYSTNGAKRTCTGTVDVQGNCVKK